MSYIAIGDERLSRRQRARYWLRRHWRWIRRRGSRDGRVLFYPTPFFTLTLDGKTTEAIPYNAPADQVRDALMNLPRQKYR